MIGMTKRFPGGVVANDDISLEIAEGEIHALLGENGAGKTTLMNILAGLLRPDEGQIFIRGHGVRFSSPRDAFLCGIGMVHQHFMLVPTFTVAQNVILGTQSPHGGIRLDLKSANRRVRDLSRQFGLLVDPEALTAQLSVSAQQKVEILKLLYRGAAILILDEPTASLAPQEIRDLFSILRRLAAEKHTIILVTHKLGEVMELADRVTVLRSGRVVTSRATTDTTPEELARFMIGRDLAPALGRRAHSATQAVLSIRSVSVRDDRGLLAVRDLSLDVGDHEIVGIAGVDGNGQVELTEALSGLREVCGGRVFIAGVGIPSGDARSLIRRFGVATIPEDRRRHGLILDFSIGENGVLPVHDKAPFARWVFTRKSAIIEVGRRLVRTFQISPADPHARARVLSGGNQQKLVLARELDRRPRIIVASQPTRGLDIAAVEYVHRRLLEAREDGAAILLISQDLDELLKLSDRLAVMYRGRIVGQCPIAEVNIEHLSHMMTTGSPSPVEMAGSARDACSS